MSTATRRKSSGESMILIVLGLVVVLGGGALFILNNMSGKPPVPPPPPVRATTVAKMETVLAGARHSRGPANAPITIVEFSDIECNHCRSAHDKVLVKLDKRKDIRFIYREFPLPSLHERAMPAAIALEAAGLQNKFWEMYDQLFDGEVPHLSDHEIEAKATKIGLDIPRFRKDLDDPKTAALINSDMDVLKSVVDEAPSTPTFFVRDQTGKTTVVTGGTSLQNVLDGKPADAPAPGDKIQPGAAPAKVPGA